MKRQPSFLDGTKKIFILSTAGYISFKELESTLEIIYRFGFRVEIGATIGTRFHQYSAPDQERLDDLQRALNDDEVGAILFARGGYGGVRIIDQIDWTGFQNNPKWLIGFSEVTVFHLYVNNRLNFQSLHAPMPSTFSEVDIECVAEVFSSLNGTNSLIRFPMSELNKWEGNTLEGELVGGNLTVIYSFLGTEKLDFKNKILFIEEIGVSSFQLDRMLISLRRSKILQGLKALIVGGLVNIEARDENAHNFGKTPKEIVLDNYSELEFPIIFNVPVGHKSVNRVLTLGAIYTIQAFDAHVELTQSV